MKKLELRMYGLVNYQLTGIQMGIQYGHAVVRYGQMIKKSDNVEELNKYNDWADNYETFIILNGGTTNTNLSKLGTLNKHLQALKDNNILCQDFYEPDLGDQLTSVVFIVDERVFNYVDYPQFEPSVIASFNKSKYDREYKGWVKKMGGEKNVFLRNFLKNFKLA